MTKWIAVKNWAANTQLWGILVILVITGGALASERKEDRRTLGLASAMLRGEKVTIFDAKRVRELYLSAGSLAKDLCEAGFTETETKQLGEPQYFQLK